MTKYSFLNYVKLLSYQCPYNFKLQHPNSYNNCQTTNIQFLIGNWMLNLGGWPYYSVLHSTKKVTDTFVNCNSVLTNCKF